MSADLLENPAFRHLRMQAKQVRLDKDEVGPIDWLFSDMNIAPDEALDAVEKLVKGLDKDRLLGALLTLKLNNWNKPQEVPELIRKMLERLLTIGFARAQAAQLYYNRQEVCVACFTPLGLERVASNASKSVSISPHRARPVKSPGSASKAPKNKM
jgi:23S rRNA C2498 (ribose-2'-O)-methylase RlmM